MSRFVALFFFSSFLGVGPASDRALADIQDRDLAIVLPAAGAPRLTATPPLFLPAWFAAIDRAFRATSVGDAFGAESGRDAWQLVAVRIAPCQPLLGAVSPADQSLCSAEVRLVWQPITARKVSSSHWPYFADDRAVHVAFHIPGGLFLSPFDAASYDSLQARLPQLGALDQEVYAALHRRLALALVQSVLDLRGPFSDSAYRGIEARPEFNQEATGRDFAEALGQWLATIARPERMLEATAFSLPAGREPALLDDWVFVAFAPMQEGRDLRPKPLVVRSPQDGRDLFSFGRSQTVSMRREDPAVYAALESMAEPDARELQANLLLWADEGDAKKQRLADRWQTHTEHTSCGSCHKLNGLNFDFHNLSYLQDHPLTVSPRTLMDVRGDLEWLNR